MLYVAIYTFLFATAASGPLFVTEVGAQAVTPDDVPLISRQLLFGDPARTDVQLSPNGQFISFLAPLDGVLNVWIAPVDDLAAAEPITDDKGRGILGYSWTYLDGVLIYVQDTDGDENWQVFSVDVGTKQTRLLTPGAGVQAQIIGLSREYTEEIVIGLNDRVPQLHDLYRVNLLTGERHLLYENEGLLGFIIDDEYNIHFGVTPTPDGGSAILAATDEGWEPFAIISMEDSLTTGPIALDTDENVLYMLDSRGRDTAALTAHDLSTGEETVIFADSQADVSHVMVHPTEHRLQAVASTYARRQWTIFDPEIKADLDYLSTVADGELNVIDRSLDDKTWLVAYVLDNGPVRVYLYDRLKGEAIFLFTNRPALENAVLAPMHPVIIPSRDGFDLVSYLTLPVWSVADPADVRPIKPLPLVLEVHGGPWARDEWGYNSVHQWLANRGYAVLSVNFRGSTGFGKSFINAGNKQWGGAMHDDLIDAVQWAVDEGIADPDKVCISGGSYGGYAALVGLTFTPDVFACGVSLVGPSNLVTLLEAIPPYWEPQIELFATRVGDHRTEEGRQLLESRSPLNYVDNIKRPLLIGQGANDPRVKQSESDQIVEAMQARNIPVTYVLYPDEGHGFVRPENRISFLAVQEAFLAQHLGGRFEPVGDDFVGSTIDILVGAEHIDGLND